LNEKARGSGSRGRVYVCKGGKEERTFAIPQVVNKFRLSFRIKVVLSVFVIDCNPEGNNKDIIITIHIIYNS